MTAGSHAEADSDFRWSESRSRRRHGVELQSWTPAWSRLVGPGPRAGHFRSSPLNPNRPPARPQADGSDLRRFLSCFVTASALSSFGHGSIWSLRPRPEWNRRPGCCNGPPGRAEHGRTAGTSEHCIRPLEQSRLCLISLTRSTYRKGLVSSVPLRYIPWWQRWRRLLHEAAAPDSAQFVRVCDPGASAPDTVRHAGRHDAPRSPRQHSRAPAFGLRRGPG